MFCKNCGKEIENDSHFCKYCGKRQTNDNKINNTDLKKGFFTLFLIFIVIITIIGIISAIIFVSYNNNNTRKTSDYDLTVQQDYTKLSTVGLIVTPKYEIENLEIIIKFYDNNNKELATKTQYLGKVNKFQEYNLTYKLSELNISSTSIIKKFTWRITKGTTHLDTKN